MSDRFILGTPSGRFQTNCYVIGDRERGSAVIVDPGENAAEAAVRMLERAGVACEAILLTHGHLDHLWSVPQLATKLDVPVLLHPADRWLWDDPAAGLGITAEQAALQFGFSDWQPPNEHLQEVAGGTRLQFAGIAFDVHHNPGHTPGHVTYLGKDLTSTPVTFDLGDSDAASDEVLFSGDLLFAGSIGRSDLPGGNVNTMMRSLKDTLNPLADDTLVLCGHGPDTTIGHERRTNTLLPH